MDAAGAVRLIAQQAAAEAAAGKAFAAKTRLFCRSLTSSVAPQRLLNMLPGWVGCRGSGETATRVRHRQHKWLTPIQVPLAGSRVLGCSVESVYWLTGVWRHPQSPGCWLSVLQVPGSINQHLRSYQREGVQFLFSRYAAGERELEIYAADLSLV